jgi:D-lactate dehydrogenase (cytochrome)
LRLDLEADLARRGLFFAPDPGADATIGGMVANNAAGIRALRYGAARDDVLGLEVVLASGEVITTGSRSVPPRGRRRPAGAPTR